MDTVDFAELYVVLRHLPESLTERTQKSTSLCEPIGTTILRVERMFGA